MALLHRAILSLALLPAGYVVCAVVAQTPSADTLRFLLQPRDGSPHPPKVTLKHFDSRSGHPQGSVEVQTSDPQAAQKAAIHYVYQKTVRNIGVPLREFARLQEETADALSQIKALKAKILSTQKTAEGYAVTVELAQTTGDIEQDLRNTAYSNFRLVALLPETIDGQRVSSPQVETALVGALADKQFRVYDWNFVSSRKPLTELVNATLSNGNAAAVQLGGRFLANVIVAGRIAANYSQDNNGIISYHATANLRVIKTDTGQILTAKQYSDKGFGQDRSQAAREALDNLAQKVAKELPNELESHFDEYPITVQLPISRPEQAEQAETFLRTLTGVKSVERALTANGATFRLTSREKPVALAARIQQSPTYRLASNDMQP